MTPSVRFESGDWVPAMYMGIPVLLRKDGEDGAEIAGFGAWLVAHLPFNG